MIAKTFSAEVLGGQLQHDEPLDAFEGQTVRVTVTAASDFDVQPPQWMAVESDVYAKISFPGEILKDAVIVDGGPLRPSLVFPEDLPDE